MPEPRQAVRHTAPYLPPTAGRARKLRLVEFLRSTDDRYVDDGSVELCGAGPWPAAGSQPAKQVRNA